MEKRVENLVFYPALLLAERYLLVRTHFLWGVDLEIPVVKAAEMRILTGALLPLTIDLTSMASASSFHPNFAAHVVYDDPNRCPQDHPRYCCDNDLSAWTIEMIWRVKGVCLVFAQISLLPTVVAWSASLLGGDLHFQNCRCFFAPPEAFRVETQSCYQRFVALLQELESFPTMHRGYSVEGRTVKRH